MVSGTSFASACVRGCRVTNPNFIGFCLSRGCCSSVIGSILSGGRGCNHDGFNSNGHILIRFISTGPANPVRVNGTHNNTLNSYLTTILSTTNCCARHRFCVGSTNGRVGGFTLSLSLECLRLCGSNVRVPRSDCRNRSVVTRTGTFTRVRNSGFMGTSRSLHETRLIGFTLPGGVSKLRDSLNGCHVGCSA